MKQLIERLKQLEAAATPGPWLETKLAGGFAVNRYIRWFPTGEDQFYNGEPDAALIAEMRNALPQLLDRLEKLEAVADAAENACQDLDGFNRTCPDNHEFYSAILLRRALAALQEDDR